MSIEKMPDGYSVDRVIDLSKDKKVAIVLNVVAVVLLFILCFLGFNFIDFNMNFKLLDVIIFVVLLFGYIIVHELLHGLGFLIVGNKKVKFGFNMAFAYAGVPDAFITKWKYQFIALLPFFVLSAVLIPLSLAFKSASIGMVLYIIFCLQFSGCVGDFYVFAVVLKKPKDILINDTGLVFTILKAVKE